jgi:hypothetical protein
MKNEIKNIFLLDDEFPKIAEFISRGVYGQAINADDLYHLALYENWGSLHYLKELIKDIVTSEPYKQGLINLIGYSNPELALSDIENGVTPHVIIYDWQYGQINDLYSQKWLIELIEKSKAFIFVYSQIGETLPQYLNKKEFNQHSNRFQLFLKGSKTNSIFYSEEFILQFILMEVVESGKLKIHGFNIEFSQNNYLKQASDILYLERIFGRLKLLEEIKKVQFSLNNETIGKILESTNEFLYYSEEKKVLISPDNKSTIDKIQSLQKISFKQVADKFSIQKLEEALERGIALI